MSYPSTEPLNDFARQSLRDCYEWFPGWDAEPVMNQVVHYGLGIAGEAGEVVEIVKKLHGGRPGYELSDPKIRERLAEEICDVMQYCGDLAAVLDLDIDYAMQRKRTANGKRFRK